MYWLSDPALVDPIETKVYVHSKTCTSVFIVASFAIGRN
jgi:hypothetical protein